MLNLTLFAPPDPKSPWIEEDDWLEVEVEVVGMAETALTVVLTGVELTLRVVVVVVAPWRDPEEEVEVLVADPPARELDTVFWMKGVN